MESELKKTKVDDGASSKAVDDLYAIVQALQVASVKIYERLQSHHGMIKTTVTFSGAPRPKINASGDSVAPLDEIADEIVSDELKACPECAGFASEERKDFVSLNEGGRFIVVYDPLDGSQNLPVGLSVGSIWGVFRAKSLRDVKSGNDMIAAGYSLFSSALQFVWAGSRKGPVSLAQYDFKNKKWSAVLKNHKIPSGGKTYCINEGSARNWTPSISTFVGQYMKGRSIRWMCCMVADVHRPLMQGGCFMYPADRKYTKGRLRLVYEAYPMAFVWEACGGFAIHADRTLRVGSEDDNLTSVKYTRILETPVPHDDVHARTGVCLLGAKEHEQFQAALTKARGLQEEWGAF